MRRLALLILLAGCGDDGGGTPDAAPPTGPITATVERYDYTFDLQTRQARAVLALAVTTGGDCVTLPLRAPLAGEVRLGGAPATATVADGALTACGAGWPDGATLELEAELMVALETWGDSQVGYSISEDANREGFWYLVSWVGGCDRFAPCDTTPSRFARYRFTVTHPEVVTVLCSGDVVAGATETTCTFEHDGGPTYSTFGLVASSGWTVTEAGAWNGVDVTIYNRTGSNVAGLIDGAWQAGFLAWMEARFGAYPYGDALRVITGPTYWSGFEHPGNIVLDDALASPFSAYLDPVNHVLAHELAHQWAGDETTLAGTYDFVWKEAMAEYLTFVYEDETVPAEAAATARAWKGFAQGAAFHPVPEEEPPLLDYYGEVYGPGPMILFRQLEALFSRAQVLDAIAAVLGEPRAIGVADVQLALEDATGADLDGYFDAWVRGTGAPAWPTFSTEVVDQGGGTVAVTVRQVTPAEPRGCAFAVELQGAAAEERHDVWIDLGVEGDAEVTVTATPGFAVVATALDPDAQCLAYPAGAAAAPRHRRGWSPWLSKRVE